MAAYHNDTCESINVHVHIQCFINHLYDVLLKNNAYSTIPHTLLPFKYISHISRFSIIHDPKSIIIVSADPLGPRGANQPVRYFMILRMK